MLPSVSNVTVLNDSDSIYVHWEPPTLDGLMSGLHIAYTITIFNVTDGTPVLYSRIVNFSRPYYIFREKQPNACNKYRFTIDTLIGDVEGGRSEPVEGFFLGGRLKSK